MANALTNTTDTIIVNAAIEAFSAALLPFTAFARNVSPAPAAKGDKVKVMSVLAADAAADFAGTYSMQDADASGLDVTLNGHKFVSWGLTDLEVTNNPGVTIETFGRVKGFQLAKAVLQDVLSLVTNANYGAAAFTGAASTFDADDVVDIGAVCDAADWPEMERSLILNGSYHAALRKDNALQDASALGSDSVIRTGKVQSLDTFERIFKCTLIPANAENLVGFAVNPDAILLAMRYLAPQAGHSYSAAAPITDPETGFTIGFREWYDPDTGTSKKVLECLYGKLKGNGSALKRLVSA